LKSAQWYFYIAPAMYDQIAPIGLPWIAFGAPRAFYNICEAC